MGKILFQAALLAFIGYPSLVTGFVTRVIFIVKDLRTLIRNVRFEEFSLPVRIQIRFTVKRCALSTEVVTAQIL